MTFLRREITSCEIVFRLERSPISPGFFSLGPRSFFFSSVYRRMTMPLAAGGGAADGKGRNPPASLFTLL